MPTSPKPMKHIDAFLMKGLRSLRILNISNAIIVELEVAEVSHISCKIRR